VVEDDDLVAPHAQGVDDAVELGDGTGSGEVAELHDRPERLVLVLGEVGAMQGLQRQPGCREAGMRVEDGDEPVEGLGGEGVCPTQEGETGPEHHGSNAGVGCPAGWRRCTSRLTAVSPAANHLTTWNRPRTWMVWPKSASIAAL